MVKTRRPLDIYLSNAEAQSVILTGASVKLAANGTATEAITRGYRVIVDPDEIESDVDDLVLYTLRDVAIAASLDSIPETGRSLE